jgi:outer membrane receptor protein involved in Fe transport
VGFDENLPWHAELNLSAGKKFGNNLSVSLTALNVTNRHLLVDNSLTFDGFHWDDPRQFYAQVDYKFGY